jgi:hypothetical protein
MVKGPKKDEVTDVDLRNDLLTFEQMVRRNLGDTRWLAP